FPYYCWGTTANDYYDTVNTLLLAGVAAVCAGIFYAASPRWYVASGIVSLFASYVYIETALSTTLPVPFFFVSILCGTGGTIVLIHGARIRVENARSFFSPKVIRVMTRPIGVSFFLVITVLGITACSSSYAGQSASYLP